MIMYGSKPAFGKVTENMAKFVEKCFGFPQVLGADTSLLLPIFMNEWINCAPSARSALQNHTIARSVTVTIIFDDETARLTIINGRALYAETMNSNPN